MIKSLVIKNFQSHQETQMEFSPGVNIIVGPSDSGKTAIIRALRWLIWNRPQGDSIRSKWGGETVVHLETDTDSIDRWKHNYENAYRLNTQTDFKALRTDVPEEIVQALNLNEINLQRQLDQPFLISETPGVVAAHFNRVANLDKIDSSVQNINSWIRELTQKVKYKEDEKAKLEEELSKFEHLEKFEMEVEVLEGMEKDYTNLLRSQTKLETRIDSLRKINEDMETYTPLLELEKPVDDILSLRTQKNALKVNRVSLWGLVSSIKIINDDIAYQEQLTMLEKPVTSLLSLYEDVNTLKSQQIRLYRALSTIKATNTHLGIRKAEYEELQAKFDEIKICPFCGSKMK